MASGNAIPVEVRASTLEEAAANMRHFGEVLLGPYALPGGPLPVEVPIPAATIAREYSELHAMYLHCSLMRELLLECATDEALNSPLFGELLGHYAGLGNEAAQLIVFLKTRILTAPDVAAVWRTAHLAAAVKP